MKMEDLLAAQKERDNLKNELELVSAEKIALDQMLVESLKSCINIRRDLVKANIEIERLKNEINEQLVAQNANALSNKEPNVHLVEGEVCNACN